MKSLNFYQVKRLCDNIAKQAKELEVTQVIAVVRGGLTPAHIIARELNLPVGCYWPGMRELVSTQTINGKTLIVEDLIAEGRTFNKAKEFFNLAYPCMEWFFAPLVIDSKYVIKDTDRILMNDHTIQTEWIKFPWETDVVEGDRGFFRDGTDAKNLNPKSPGFAINSNIV